jgi:hypothetical protein
VRRRGSPPRGRNQRGADGEYAPVNRTVQPVDIVGIVVQLVLVPGLADADGRPSEQARRSCPGR